MPTDLPEPVVPATSRCGMRARSAMTGAPPMSLPSASASRACWLGPFLGAEQFGQKHRLALRVRHLDADHVAAGHGGDAHGGHRQAARHVVGQPDHAGAADARGWFQFIQRHHRARAGSPRCGPARRNRPAPSPAAAHWPATPRRSVRRRWRAPAPGSSSDSGGQRHGPSSGRALLTRGRRIACWVAPPPVSPPGARPSP